MNQATDLLAVRGQNLWNVMQHLFVRTPAKIRSVLISGVVNPSFFLFILGFGLGSLVDEQQSDPSAVDSLGTDSYLAFVGPALLAISAILWGFSQSLWPTASMITWDKTYVIAANTPVTKTELAVAHILWIGFRFGAASFLFTGVLFLAGAISSWWALLMPVAGFLVVIAISSLVCAYTVVAKNEMGFAALFRLIALPMFLFSGAFFPLDQVPGIVGWVVKILPGWHGVELCRRFATGAIEVLPIAGHIGYLVLTFGLGLMLSIRSFTKVLGDA